MKKVVYLLICCMVFAFSTAYALDMKATPGNVYLTDMHMNRGTEVPTNEFDLSAGNYSGSFYFTRGVYTDVLFKNINRIAVSINCEPDSPNIINDVFFVKCIKKTFLGQTTVGTLTMSRYGDSGTFTNLSTSDKYFLRFEKAEDGVYLSGTFVISD